MSNINAMFDNKTVQSLNAKLNDFYQRWDTMSKLEKDELIVRVKEALTEVAEALKEINECEPKPELLAAKRELKEKMSEIEQILGDIQLALEHRAVSNTLAMMEHVKKLAEAGNADAIKAWEKLKPDYIAMLQSGQQPN